MEIKIIRKEASRWGIDGECYIENQKVCDTVEHPTAHRSSGKWAISMENRKEFFVQGNGPMKNLHGEICVGRYALKGLVLDSANQYWKLQKRMLKAINNNEEVFLIIN